jgi:hypothetical protein
MGDFLDDYLDGLSSGMQRFDPIPTGPYNGTKQKRQWHQMADSEREQAIYEARMREEEDSAGYGEAGSGSGNGAELIQTVAPVAPNDPDPIITYPTVHETETFGSITTSSGNVSYIEEDLAASGYPNTQVVVTQLTHDELVSDMNIMSPPTNATYSNSVYSLGMAAGGALVWVTPTQPVNSSYPGYFDQDTGVAKPMYALGQNYAIVFRVVDAALATSGIFAIETNDTGLMNLSFTPGFNGGMTDLSLSIDVYTPTRNLLDYIRQEYNAQAQKYWSYGVVEVT